MNSFTVIRLEINNYNGFMFDLIDIEYKSFEGSLIGLHFAKSYLQISLLFMLIEVKKPF